MKKVIIKPHRSGPFKAHHPWLFSGAIGQVTGNPAAGDIVLVCDDKDEFVAWGIFNPHSQIRVRLYSFHFTRPLTEDFWVSVLSKAIYLRTNVLSMPQNSESACRLINSEGDGLSGLTVDRYGEYLTVQFTALGLYLRKDALINALVELCHPRGIILRTEQDILSEEGLAAKDGLLYGELPAAPVIITENGINFSVNLSTGQKTGFYLDQRANRILLEKFSPGKKVLDLCTYTGGFALHAARAGASDVTAVDISAPALELARYNAGLNNIQNIEFIKSDMFRFLDKAYAEGLNYDVIILDPPKMTHSKAAVTNAMKGYLSLNSAALKILSPHGILFTCSCSGRVSREVFLQTLNAAAVHAEVPLQIIEFRGADADHPVSVSCPETQYLKCVVANV